MRRMKIMSADCIHKKTGVISKIKYVLAAIAAVAVIIVLSRAAGPSASSETSAVFNMFHSKGSNAVYGITLDNVTAHNVDASVAAIRKMSVKPTVRVVLDPDRTAKSYAPSLLKLHKVAYIMLCPCDSSFMKNYPTVKAYHERFAECTKFLAKYVDIWEVGNEVNGEGWLGGTSETISARIYDAYKYIDSKGYKTELTPYSFKPGDQSMTMEAWLGKYIPGDMKKGLDYVMISYYDDDNDGLHDQWKTTFYNLHNMFPKAKLGFGECGFSKPHKAGKEFNKQVAAYYKMERYNSSYVGGYFWWYWQEDCVPAAGNSRWSRINQACSYMSKNL